MIFKPDLRLLLTLGWLIYPLPIAAQPALLPDAALAPRADHCRPSIDPRQPQYIVGYGSLMATASKEQTAPTAGENLPIMVTGFERGWFIQGSSYSPTTYLGAMANPRAQMNAVIYRLPLAAELAATDRRESGYCRVLVDARQIEMLDRSVTPQGQIWMYTVQPDKVIAPNADFPIVQSYVDIMLGGCLEIEKNFAIEQFAEMCVTTTTGWSQHWVNDRIYPRRPFIHQPRSREIDQLLEATIPELLKSRKIE